MPAAKKQTKKSNDLEKHIEFLYKELEDLKWYQKALGKKKK